jgi:serine/threonine-protein kinase
MAPEQLHGGNVTRQTDIYAAAVVLWETLTGQRLFEGDNEARVLVKALEGRVTPPSQLVPGLSPGFDQVIARGMSRDPARRFPTAREMAIALEKCWRMATPSEVGEWVEHVAGDELNKRAAQIAEIESVSSAHHMMRHSAQHLVEQMHEPASFHERRGPTSSIPTRTEVPSRTDPPSQVTSMSVARTGDIVPRRRSRLGLMLVLGLLLGAVCAVVLIAFRPMKKERAPAPAAANRPTPPPEDTPPTIGDFPTTPPAPASAPPTVSSPPVIATPTATTPPRRVPRPAPAPPPQPRVDTNCDPPFTIDAQGHKKYKIECMEK